MPLTEQQLADDLAQAMKAREAQRVSVLRGVVAAAKNLKVERRGAELAESDLVQLVRRELKKRDEAESFAAKAGRADLVDQNREERAILERYVPAMLDAERLEMVVAEVIAAGATNLGAVMAALRERHAGQYDGKLASEIVRRRLSGGPTT
ncbi:MAG: GatB/YqeY domain-containing protein [bacterium]|nr:GatB/YqeY domain-containing protein [bacterium]